MQEVANEYRTEQESFWAGEFGDEYTERNQDEGTIISNTVLFAEVLSSTESVGSLIEFGANIGLNLLAIRALVPDMQLAAVEINRKAVSRLEKIDELKVYPVSILDFEPETTTDLVLTKTFLIHMRPDTLPKIYEKLYQASSRYICIAEYYNPTPVEVDYRGHGEKLFKRDFAGEMMDMFGDLELIDYGFAYHRDNNFPQDDITWFLMEKRPCEE